MLFCATVLEVFDDELTGDRRQMAMHSRQAWEHLVEFRKDWDLSG